MKEITCDMCMDLMPLVKDGIASEDSRIAVEKHISGCETCKKLYEEYRDNVAPAPEQEEEAFEKMWRRMKLFVAVLMMFGIFFGLGLTANEDMFYNSVIMPVIGVLGYFIFRWKAVYVVPLLMLFSNLLSWPLALLRGLDPLDMASALLFTLIYSGFVIVGVVIAGLLHFVFRKE